jgi:hypothetical protein
MALSLDIGRLRRGSLRERCSGHLSYVGIVLQHRTEAHQNL